MARYIIGIAAFISGDLDYSEALFLDLLNNAHLQKSLLPPLKKMRQRVPIRLGEIYAHRASEVYESWRGKRDSGLIGEMWTHLKKLKHFYPDHYSGRLLTAIYYFVEGRNIVAAIREVRKCRNFRDATWRYSYAFLLAYKGEMFKARKIYRSAFRYHYDRLDVPFQTEEFILWVLSEEPDKVQLYFCLGLVNMNAKNDKEQAIKDFKSFLNSDKSKLFPNEIGLAKSYISSLQGEMKKETKKP